MKKNIVCIKQDYCKGCRLCTFECKFNVLSISDEINALGYFPAVVKNPSACTGCSLCAIACPEGIIEITREEE